MVNTNKLVIINWNANGLNPKRTHEFKYFLEQHNVDIAIVTETHVKLNKKPQSIKNYKVTFKNRIGARGGGVAIYFKDNLGAEEIHLDREFESEVVGIKLIDNTNIYGIYVKSCNLITDEIEHLLSQRKTIIAGDFNARHTD